METQQNSSAVTQGNLEVPGATLYYETKGEGPLLLLIPGANGDHFIYAPLREILAQEFTVVTYDRRGFSGSTLTGPQDYSVRISTDADDAAALIRHLSKAPATVFASSSGALVALQLLIRHPAILKVVVAHEPTLLRVLPDAEKWINLNLALYDIYTKEGAAAAMQKFAAEYIPGSKDGELMKRGNGADSPNRTYWFEHELRDYPAFNFDMPALEAAKAKLVFAIGRESSGMLPAIPNTLMAKQFGTEILWVPGGHLGYLTTTTDFARELLAGLKERGFLNE